MSSPVKNLSGGSIDGDLSVSGKVKGAQGSASGEAVMLGSDGKIPGELVNLPDMSDYATNEGLDNHTLNKSNPHEVTKAQIGLANVDNTSDLNKPISTATQAALDGKVPVGRKINGKPLTTDVTLGASDVGALPDTTVIPSEITVDPALSDTSTNPVQNKIVKQAVDKAQADATSALSQVAEKVSTIPGKGLSTEDYTTAEKAKLAGIADGAQVNVVEAATFGGVPVPLSGKVLQIPGVDVPTKVSDLSDAASYAKVSQIPSVPTDVSAFVNDMAYLSMKILTALPSTGEAGYIYSVPDPDGEDENVRKEYYWTGSAFELLGGSGGSSIEFFLNVTITASAGTPDLSGITVTATPSAGAAVSGSTDAEGKVILAVKQGQTYSLTYSKTNFSITGDTSVTITDINNSASATCYEMPKITVTLTGSNISGRTVTLKPSSGSSISKTTDSSGKAVFEGLAITTYTITSDYPSGQGVSPASTTQATAAGGSYSVSLQILSKPTLSVTVSSDTGNVSGRTIRATPSSGTTVTATTNASGVATLTLMGGVTYTVSCDVPSGYFSMSTVSKTIAAGSSDTATFTLQRKPTVTVTVTDASGAGLQSGRIVQMSNGTDIQTATTNGLGSATFTANGTGTYTFTITDLPDGASIVDQTVSMAADGSYSVSIEMTFGWTHSVLFNETTFKTDPTGCLTYSDNASGQTPVSNSSTSLAKATTEGMWAFDPSTGMDCEGCFYATFTSAGVLHQLLNPYNLTQYIAVWNSSSKSWDYSQTGSSAITTENTMFVIPTIYYKGETGKLTLSSKADAGTARAHTIGGHTYQYLAIGVYLGYNESSKLVSKSGKTASGNITRANFRTYAKANTVSNGVALQMNYHMWRLLTFMCWIRAKSFNLQARVGNGGLSYSASTTGLCDALGPYAGNVSGTSNANKCMIENFWGSMYQWVDDAYNSGTAMYIGQNASPTDDTANKESITVFNYSSGFPNAIQQGDLVWGWGTNGDGSSSTGLCDYQNLTSTSSPVPFVGGDSGSASSGRAGPSYVARGAVSDSTSAIGARLAFVFDA